MPLRWPPIDAMPLTGDLLARKNVRASRGPNRCERRGYLHTPRDNRCQGLRLRGRPRAVARPARARCGSPRRAAARALDPCRSSWVISPLQSADFGRPPAPVVLERGEDVASQFHRGLPAWAAFLRADPRTCERLDYCFRPQTDAAERSVLCISYSRKTYVHPELAGAQRRVPIADRSFGRVDGGDPLHARPSAHAGTRRAGGCNPPMKGTRS